jgi:hypothetical protein
MKVRGSLGTVQRLGTLGNPQSKQRRIIPAERAVITISYRGSAQKKALES